MENDELYISEMQKGLQLAEYRMLRDKAMKGLDVIHGDRKGGWYEVPARELFARLYPQEAATL